MLIYRGLGVNMHRERMLPGSLRALFSELMGKALMYLKSYP
jgi:hypothetical protein